jgi:hypothetical protein
VEVLEFENERRGKGRLGFQTWVRIFGMLQPAMSPGRWVPTVGALIIGATGQSGGAPDRSCRLSGAPSSACSDFCARRHAL